MFLMNTNKETTTIDRAVTLLRSHGGEGDEGTNHSQEEVEKFPAPPSRFTMNDDSNNKTAAQEIAVAASRFERGMVGVPMGEGQPNVILTLLMGQKDWMHAVVIQPSKALHSYWMQHLSQHGFVAAHDTATHPDTKQTVRVCTVVSLKRKGKSTAEGREAMEAAAYEHVDIAILPMEGPYLLHLPLPLPTRRWWFYTSGIPQASLSHIEQHLAIVDPQVSINLASVTPQRVRVEVAVVERKASHDLKMPTQFPTMAASFGAGNIDLGKLTDAKLDALLA
jgi:hypothetical protein